MDATDNTGHGAEPLPDDPMLRITLVSKGKDPSAVIDRMRANIKAPEIKHASFARNNTHTWACKGMNYASVSCVKSMREHRIPHNVLQLLSVPLLRLRLPKADTVTSVGVNAAAERLQSSLKCKN